MIVDVCSRVRVVRLHFLPHTRGVDVVGGIWTQHPPVKEPCPDNAVSAQMYSSLASDPKLRLRQQASSKFALTSKSQIKKQYLQTEFSKQHLAWKTEPHFAFVCGEVFVRLVGCRCVFTRLSSTMCFFVGGNALRRVPCQDGTGRPCP